MTCFNPLLGVRDLFPNKNGNFPLIFSPSVVSKHSGRDVLRVACGNCIGCRVKRSSDWAFRMMCESRAHFKSSYITLTYSPENLPISGSLVLDDFQHFLKRLRSRLDYDFGVKIRFFHCGEYGDLNRRPHYHAIIFGWNFPDQFFHKRLPSGFDIFRSPLLEEVWPFGYSSVGDVSFESCAYVARYITKKINGPQADDHYLSVSRDGEIVSIKPEYCTMSRMPGIGYDWFMRGGFKDIYPKDFLTFNRGVRKVRPPKYFDLLYKSIDPFGYDDVISRRLEVSILESVKSTQRLIDMEFCFKQKMSLLVRSLE